MKKVIIINGSPRKNFNTAKLLKEAKKGAELSGAETEYFNLYDINFKFYNELPERMDGKIQLSDNIGR